MSALRFEAGNRITIAAVAGLSNSVAIVGANYLGGGESMMVYNPSTTDCCCIAFGDAAVVATTADFPVPPGAVFTVEIPRGATTVAAIMDAGGGVTVSFYPVQEIGR